MESQQQPAELPREVAEDRRDSNQPSERMLGRVIFCDGSTAVISAAVQSASVTLQGFWAVGRLISISLQSSRLVCLVYKINSSNPTWNDGQPNVMQIHVELIGAVRDSEAGPVFSRGISDYPPLGAVAHRIRARDLMAVHNPVGRRSAVIGQLSQDESIAAVVCIDDMLKRHFAVLGTTGVGKSSALSLLVHNAVAMRSGLRVLIIDPHNEFARSFPDTAVGIGVDELDLPFWLFQLAELAEAIFRGTERVDAEYDVLRELIPIAKSRFRNRNGAGLVKRSVDHTRVTADTPLPYRMSDLLALIDEAVGKLEGRHDRATLRHLKSRIEALLNDPRYRFMFASRTVDDTMAQVLGKIFRVPDDGRPISVLQLAGLPSEVVNSVVSVLCRLAFDTAMWSGGQFETLVVCEEAHRYVPQDRSLGFGPARRAIARIAKEGRKYGSYLGVVSQRPGELDPTILSQCSTVFAMRLANDRDQGIIRSAIADSSASTISFMASIGNREAIAFGEGIATPMRMRFADLPDALVPGSSHQDPEAPGEEQANQLNLPGIIARMRAMEGGGA